MWVFGRDHVGVIESKMCGPQGLYFITSKDFLKDFHGLFISTQLLRH